MTSSEGSLQQTGWIAWLRPSLLPWLTALALLLLPDRYLAPLREGLTFILRPGQVAAMNVREASTAAMRRARLSTQSGARLAELEEQNLALETQTRELKLALQLARTEAETLRQRVNTGPEQTAALLMARPLAARVLGAQTRGFLSRRTVLDAGAEQGVDAGALVLSQPRLDLGDDSGLATGHLVLLGREVWGQIASVDRWTSGARHVTQAGYRDIVQLAYPGGDRLRLGPHGVLEGTGEPLCRIRMIAVTEPASVGDVVLADGGGTLSEPLCYGTVVRVEQPRGAAHWEIWMQPAIPSAELHGTVAVLRTELNPDRLGAVSSNTR